jgi:pimeloyl-ACP methyl ester carboxylesterase
MSSLTSGNVGIHFTDSGGDGRPVVLIHGWPLSGASWSDLEPALTEAGYRVVTYDRRGFGQSDKPGSGSSYDYDTLTSDLVAVMDQLNLQDATLIGFSMGGGEVARYVGTQGTGRLHSVVFAAAIPPWLLKSDENPDGGLDRDSLHGLQDALREDREGFLDGFLTNFFSANGELKVTEDQRQQALTLALQSEQTAAVACMESWLTNFRDDLAKASIPTLVIHGDADAIVPIEVSGQRTHELIDGSELHVVADGPHGINTSHADEFNRAVLAFLER